MILKKQHAFGHERSPPERSGCSTCHSALLSVALIIRTKEVPHVSRYIAPLLCLHRFPAHGCPCLQTPRESGLPSLPSPAHPATLRGISPPTFLATDALASGFPYLLSRYDLIFPGSATPPHGQAPSRLLSSSRPSKEPTFRLPSSLFFQADTPRAHGLQTAPPFTAPFPSPPLAPPCPASRSGSVITAPSVSAPPLPHLALAD